MPNLLFTRKIHTRWHQPMLLTLAALAVVIACRQPVEASETPAVSQAPMQMQAAVPVQTPEPAPTRQYTFEATAVQLKPGGTVVATVTIKPVKGMKFNKEFPAKFTVEAAAFAKSTKDKLTMKDGDVKVAGVDGVLSIPLTGVAAGAGTLKVVGNFSICNEEQCYMLRNEQLSLAVTVK